MRPTVEERFWAKVRVAGDDECWEWIGAKNKDGYGYMLRSLRPTRWYRSNRLAWELAHGPIPDGLHVLHTCDNRPCVNTRHLYLGTQADNNRDRDQRGRLPDRRGAMNSNARLTTTQVAEIRSRYPAESQARLAEEFGVKQAQISRIVRRTSWVEE